MSQVFTFQGKHYRQPLPAHVAEGLGLTAAGADASAGSDASTDVAQDFAEDYPGRAALVKLGLAPADVDALDRDGLVALKGIGEATADEILALRG